LIKSVENLSLIALKRELEPNVKVFMLNDKTPKLIYAQDLKSLKETGSYIFLFKNS
jgi:hypothetical protein